MKSGIFRILCVTSALALVVAFGTPQVGKRKGGGTSTSGGGGGSSSGGGGGNSGGGGGNSGGGGGNSGGGGGGNHEPPPVRTTTGGGSSGGGGGYGRGGGGGDQSDNRGGGVYGGGWPNRNDGGQGTVISQGGLGRRKGDSHSGNVQYGTSNNVVQVGSVKIYRPPQLINPGMQQRVLDREHVQLVQNGWRCGYHHYDPRWCDDYFYYPFYVFNPWDTNRFVCSPWYYYASCPPYLNSSRIIIINAGWPSYNWNGDPYRWNRPDWSNRWTNYSDLDYALDDLSRAFERGDSRSVDRMIPRDGNVHLYFDGRYGYSLSARDFYDLFVDGIENVRTSRYDIMDVRYDGRGEAKVTAKQEYVDPWGQRNYSYQTLFLVQEGRDWVIREFGTSNYRPY